MQILILGWLIAGSIASWLANETWGRGPLGIVADWLAGLAGAIVGVLAAPLIVWLVSSLSALLHQEVVEHLDWWGSIQGLDWWVSTPLAFLGALLFIRTFRILFRVRISP